MTTTHTLEVRGATLTYDLHGEEGTDLPLLLVGSPMGADGFASLVSHLPGRRLVTLDPRNVGRSERTDRLGAVSARQHAEDLHALVVALGTPVDVLASSGGATNALVWVAAHPDDVRTLVAHEPPMASVLPDRAEVNAACDAIVAAYDAGGTGPAIARFIGLVMHRGPVDAAYLDAPAPDPAAFGLPTEDDGVRDDALVANMRDGGIDAALDVAALRAAATRVVVAVGEESGGPEDGEIAGRAAYAVAAALGQEAVVFPSGHGGFLGGEHGQTGKPAEFAARLREVLADEVLADEAGA